MESGFRPNQTAVTDDCCRKCYCRAFKRQVTSQCKRGKVRLVRTNVKRCKIINDKKRCDRLKFFQQNDAPFKKTDQPKLYNFEPLRKPECRSLMKCQKDKSCLKQNTTRYKRSASCQKMLRKCPIESCIKAKSAPCDQGKSESDLKQTDCCKPSKCNTERRESCKPSKCNTERRDTFKPSKCNTERRDTFNTERRDTFKPSKYNTRGSDSSDRHNQCYSEDEDTYSDSTEGSEGPVQWDSDERNSKASCFTNLLQDLKADIVDIDNILDNSGYKKNSRKSRHRY